MIWWTVVGLGLMWDWTLAWRWLARKRVGQATRRAELAEERIRILLGYGDDEAKVEAFRATYPRGGLLGHRFEWLGTEILARSFQARARCGENFVTMAISCPGEAENLICTIQKAGRKTPAERYIEVSQELAELKARRGR